MQDHKYSRCVLSSMFRQVMEFSQKAKVLETATSNVPNRLCRWASDHRSSQTKFGDAEVPSTLTGGPRVVLPQDEGRHGWELPNLAERTSVPPTASICMAIKMKRERPGPMGRLWCK